MSIEVDHISYTYMAHTALENKALDDVSFTVDKGEFVALIGHTGSGKSTLAEHLNGLLHPDTGEVRVDGVDLAGKDAAAKAAKYIADHKEDAPQGRHGFPVSGTSALCRNHL